MKAWEITRKDLKLLVRDVRTFVVLLALPVLFIWIIGMITGRLAGFNEPNRVLNIGMVDEIDYDALGRGPDGQPLPADEAERQRKLARNVFVKVYNNIQQESGLEVEEVTDVETVRRQYGEGDANGAFRIGPEFYRRVRGLSHRDVLDRDRGGLAFRFEPPEDLTVFAARRDGLEQRIAEKLGIDPAEIEVFSEDVDLELAEIVLVLPQPIVKRFFDEEWERITRMAGGEAGAEGESQGQPAAGTLRGLFAEASRPLEQDDVHPSGLRYELESLNTRLESESPGSASHTLVESVFFSKALSAISLYPLCGSNNTRSQVGQPCLELEAEADRPAIALLPPLPVEESASRVYQEVIPGYTVLFVFFLINIMARSFIHERALGTLRRLRIAPVRPTSLLAGKTLPFLFVSLVQTAMLFLFGKTFFGMSWGPKPELLIPVIVCTSLAATSLGLLVATIVNTESQVSAYANLVVITTGLISGSMFPRDWLPALMKDISLITPHAWALIAYDEILSIRQDPSVPIIMQCCAALIGFTVLFFAIGTLRFGKVD